MTSVMCQKLASLDSKIVLTNLKRLYIYIKQFPKIIVNPKNYLYYFKVLVVSSPHTFDQIVQIQVWIKN